jgi:hypothetical protein
MIEKLHDAGLRSEHGNRQCSRLKPLRPAGEGR